MRRIALRALVASVTISAAMGILALLGGHFSAFQGKVLVTSFTVSGASVMAISCGVAWERGRLGPAPPAGVAVSLAGATLLVVAVWTSFGIDPLNRSAGTLFVAGAAFAHGSLLSLATLAPRHRWIQRSAYALAALLAVTIIAQIWAELDGQGMARLIGIELILLSAATILVPVLQRLVRLDTAPAPPTDPGMVDFCPSCGAALGVEPGAVVCRLCGAEFTIAFPGSAGHGR